MSEYTSRIRNRIIALGTMLLSVLSLHAQQATVDQAAEAVQEAIDKYEPLFQGVTFSVDLVGAATKFVGDYGSYEGAFRVNLKNKYFPVFEYGLGSADKTDDITGVHYKASAPYFRAGIDFNMLKNKRQGNRLYVGFRGGFTAFEYDSEAPLATDPIWNKPSDDLSLKGVSANASWMEIVVGLEAEVFKNLHIGWSARYKARLSQKKQENGEPWYVPGYGVNDTSGFGVTYNLIFDLPFFKIK